MALIGIDATSISVSGKGVSRYQHNLIKNLVKIDKKNQYYVFLNKRNILPELPRQSNFNYVNIYIPSHLAWDQLLLPCILQKYKFDIYHTTSETLPVIGKTKFSLYIFEIPDYRIKLMSISRRSSFYDKISYGYNKLFFSYSLLKASIIMASSESTKDDLVKKYGVDENKVSVLYPGVDEHFCATNNKEALLDTKRKYDAESGYILHISSNDPRDNTPTVIRAYHDALPRLKIYKKLVIGGNIDFMAAEFMSLITELGLKDSVIFAGYFPANRIKELVALYQAADLYVDPSFYEGFGFQVAEAMACGVPVITSNVTSLPEVVGGAGVLLPPQDIDSLAYEIVRIINDPLLSQQMGKKSLERTRIFSWEAAARKTVESLNKYGIKD